MGAGSNGIIFDDLEWPLIPISRSRHFSTLNISETTRDSYYGTSIGSRMRSIERWYFQWPWQTPTRRISRSRHFLKTNIGKQARLKDKVTVAQEETISNIWNSTMFGDLDWPLNASRGFVSIGWVSCLHLYLSQTYSYIFFFGIGSVPRHLQLHDVGLLSHWLFVRLPSDTKICK